MVKQRKDHFIYLGKKIRVDLSNGYFNATELCSAGGVHIGDFACGQTYKDYIANLPEGVVPKYFVPSGDMKGTWVHPKIKRPLWDWIKNSKHKKKNRVKIRNPERNANFFYAKDSKQFKAVENFFAITPQEYQVDHIIPLNSKTICGLNVPWNMQVTQTYYNIYKSSSFDPNKFVEQTDKTVELLNVLMIHYINSNSSGVFK